MVIRLGRHLTTGPHKSNYTLGLPGGKGNFNNPEAIDMSKLSLFPRQPKQSSPPHEPQYYTHTIIMVTQEKKLNSIKTDLMRSKENKTSFLFPRYHHLTVLVYCFYCFSQFTSCARWFMVMNYFVHSVMYSYYALRAMR